MNNTSLELYNTIVPLLTKYIKINFPNYVYNMEDIIHDVYLKILFNGKYNDLKGTMSTYYTNICKNHIFDIYRKKQVVNRYMNTINNQPKSEIDIEYKYGIEYLDMFSDILQHFEEDDKYIIIEHIINKTQIKSLAGIMDIDDNVLTNKIIKLKIKLKKMIETNYF